MNTSHLSTPNSNCQADSPLSPEISGKDQEGLVWVVGRHVGYEKMISFVYFVVSPRPPHFSPRKVQGNSS